MVSSSKVLYLRFWTKVELAEDCTNTGTIFDVSMTLHDLQTGKKQLDQMYQSENRTVISSRVKKLKLPSEIQSTHIITEII